MMWFEPGQFPDSQWNSVGFEKPPGGEIGSSTHLYNDHTYCCQAGPSVCASGEPLPTMAKRCKEFHDKKMGERDEVGKRLGVPVFWSEFGACTDSETCITEINQVADNAEKYLHAGWAYWQFKTYEDLTTTAGTSSEGFYNKDGSLQTGKIKALSRTYVKSAQGTI
jgi:hypothetical protein